MRQEQESILAMISSPDRDNRYLAASILRSGKLNLPGRTITSLLRKISIFDRVVGYSDICLELGQKELTLEDFSNIPEPIRKKSLAHAKLLQITMLLNGKWVADWSDGNQYKWYPYFENKPGRGLVFLGSDSSHRGDSHGLVAFKDQPTSDFVGHTFPELYRDMA